MGVAGLVDIKKRIKSVESTKKLTKAMGLVATSKLKKARVSLDKSNSYFKSYKEIMEEVLNSLPKDNKYIKVNNKAKGKLIIVLTSSMGMCGGFNFNVVNKLQEIIENSKDTYEILAIGDRGKALMKRYKLNTPQEDLKFSDIPSVEEAKEIFNYAFQKFNSEEVKEVILLYTRFKNQLIKEPVEKVMLPITFNNKEKETLNTEFDIEGNKEDIIETLAASFCKAMVYNAMINSKVSEHSFRMETMNSATKNAEDLINNLKTKFNRIRQGAITQEISEIVGGSEAQG